MMMTAKDHLIQEGHNVVGGFISIRSIDQPTIWKKIGDDVRRNILEAACRWSDNPDQWLKVTPKEIVVSNYNEMLLAVQAYLQDKVKCRFRLFSVMGSDKAIKHKNQTLSPTIIVGRDQLSYNQAKTMVEGNMPDRELTLYLTPVPTEVSRHMKTAELREAIRKGNEKTVNTYFPDLKTTQDLYCQYNRDTTPRTALPETLQVPPTKKTSHIFVPEK